MIFPLLAITGLQRTLELETAESVEYAKGQLWDGNDHFRPHSERIDLQMNTA
jgi:hypothetical protein